MPLRSRVECLARATGAVRAAAAGRGRAGDGWRVCSTARRLTCSRLPSSMMRMTMSLRCSMVRKLLCMSVLLNMTLASTSVMVHIHSTAPQLTRPDQLSRNTTGKSDHSTMVQCWMKASVARDVSFEDSLMALRGGRRGGRHVSEQAGTSARRCPQRAPGDEKRCRAAGAPPKPRCTVNGMPARRHSPGTHEANMSQRPHST